MKSSQILHLHFPLERLSIFLYAIGNLDFMSLNCLFTVIDKYFSIAFWSFSYWFIRFSLYTVPKSFVSYLICKYFLLVLSFNTVYDIFLNRNFNLSFLFVYGLFFTPWKSLPGTSLVEQWLRIPLPAQGKTGSIPGPGRSHTPRSN